MSMNATDVVRQKFGDIPGYGGLAGPEPPAIPIIKGFSMLMQS